ncbi:MAG: peptide chain release factor 1 [Kordiimonadaceae bacterium]|jgi:peptide chain release factor 1|nr:peptide chain release factor 1 [Kordiimonadaceae bacterium]MDB4219152.1 peptide chain release factor 1 [Emcibacteraceae bacterium]MBT6467744.1 peptide chain release factor 1 [Kordiimonadaceae bacterium]MBT7605152.1 peptide chain release factor 1 [Kordiimonadaceae bacterium]MDC0082451.1 peptide chain release factor 1 [Emcibacteraceae bacterium]|tara:strand:- start:6375 stop:7454 length:1080 start_codon:yes stop_codon:yes gene_type:complete
MIPRDRLEQFITRHEELEHMMSGGEELSSEDFVKISREYSDLTPVVEQSRNYLDLIVEIQELAEIIIAEDTEVDIRNLAEMEMQELKGRIPSMERQVQLMLLPKDVDDDKNAMLEIRAGTGGDEAALFAGNLFRMYQKYATLQGWRFEIMSTSSSDAGGFKEAFASVSGPGVFAKLKYEAGGHRVQRVPETETQGRIHTSAATVAVMPEVQEIDIKLDDKDLRIDIFRASGPGGQSVNTTDSAVRIVHIPTGITVQQQDEKSQHKNKAKAMKVLMSRVYAAEKEARDAERSADRKDQIGSGDRSARIRTYNFPQGRMTDHRINLTLYKLDQILAGEGLEEVITALITENQAAQLAELEN